MRTTMPWIDDFVRIAQEFTGVGGKTVPDSGGAKKRLSTGKAPAGWCAWEALCPDLRISAPRVVAALILADTSVCDDHLRVCG